MLRSLFPGSRTKYAGTLVRDISELPRRLDQGFTQVAVQSDLALLRDAFSAILRTARAIP